MIKVGDIVRTKNKEGKVLLPAVVTAVYENDVIVLFSDGTYGYRSEKKYECTGNHIDMQSVLDSIR